MTAVVPAGPAEFRAVFPAVAGAVAAVRAYVRAVAGCGVRPGGLEVIASELASAAVRLQAGGTFTVTVRRGPGGGHDCWQRVVAGR